MRILVLAAGAAAALALGALAVFLVTSRGGDDEATVVDLRVPCTNDATAEAIRTSNQRGFEDDDRGTPIPFRFVDDEMRCRVRRAMLVPEDLGAEWQWSVLARGDGIQQEFSFGPCLIASTYVKAAMSGRFERGHVTPRDEKTPGITPDDDLELISQNVFVMSDGRGAETFEAVRRACAASPMEDEGESYWVEPEVSPALGDESYAVRRFNDFSDDESVIPENLIFVRFGDVIMEFNHFGFDEVEFEDTVDLVGLAASRLERHLSLLDENHDAESTPTPALAGIQLALNSGLLQPEDVPPSWVPVTDVEPVSPEDLSFCSDARASYPDPRHTAEISYAIARPAGGNALLETLMLFETEEDAAVALQQLRESPWYVDGCDGHVGEDDVRWRFARLVVEEGSGESAAWRAISKYCCPDTPQELGDLPYVADVQFDFVAVRRGPLLAVLIELDSAPRGHEAVDRELQEASSFLLDDLIVQAEARMELAAAALAEAH